MEAKLFAKMLSDKNVTDLKKMKHKYPEANMDEFIKLLTLGAYKELPIKDFNGAPLVYLENVAQMNLSAVKVLLTPQNSAESFGLKAMEDEIISTLTIENIDSSRDSVRRILKGYAPTNDSENRIYGMKKGLDFIGNPENKITEENIYKLYQLMIGEFLNAEDKLLPDNYYRHDEVFVVCQELEHTGLPHQKLAEYMDQLVDFINEGSKINDLLKAAVIHFYLAYLHPYFDGNGRMARMLHLWYLVQQGYSSALFVPLSEYIEKSRKRYYDAYTLAERNQSISGVMDATPFLVYFIENVYNKLSTAIPERSTDTFKQALDGGKITEKEQKLWYFVLSAYGNAEFSTKQLEKDYGDAAYATIRGFVLKFEKMGLLTSQKYSNRVKYRMSDSGVQNARA